MENLTSCRAFNENIISGLKSIFFLSKSWSQVTQYDDIICSPEPL